MNSSMTILQNDISCYDHSECPFNDAVDYLWHQSGKVIRCVVTFISEIDEIESNL
jgi:hypothetical protein